MLRAYKMVRDSPPLMRLIESIQTALDDHPGEKSSLTVHLFAVGICVMALAHPNDPMLMTFITQVTAELPRDIAARLTAGRTFRRPTYRMMTHLKKRLDDLPPVATTEAAPGPAGNSYGDGSGSLSNFQLLADAILQASVPDLYRSRTRCRATDSHSIHSYTRMRKLDEGTANDGHHDPTDRDLDLAEDTPVATDSDTAEVIAAKDNWSTRDPEADWIHMPAKNGRRSFQTLGFYLHSTVLVPEEDRNDVPNLTTHVTLTTGASGYAAAAVSAIRTEQAQGHQVNELLVDQGYSGKVASDFAIPLHKVGVRIVYDLPKQREGYEPTRNNLGGAVIVDGDLFCPGAPFLDGLPRIPRNGKPQSVADLNEAYNARSVFRFGVRAYNIDEHGSCRAECPAKAGRAVCPIVETSNRLPLGTPAVLDVPEHPGLACTQATITAPVTFASRRQKHAYGTTAHTKSKARRTGVERSFAAATTLHGKLDRSTVRSCGIGIRTLLLAVKLAMGNLEAIDAWEHHHPAG